MIDNAPWPRVIILVDLNAFFASIEQLDFPQLRNKPIAITNGEKGSCIITSSYEARKYGVRTGMRLTEARKLCPNIIQRQSRTKRYTDVSATIMRSLTKITPDIEVYSVDEAFLDVSHCQMLHGSPYKIATMVKQVVYEASGLYCSVGVSGDKTTAKYAAKLHKPNGLTLIHPEAAKLVLQNIPVTELCGIADGIGTFLARHNVQVCGDMEHLPIAVLKNKYGPLGERIWYMAQGLDPSPVKQHDKPTKSVGHGKVLPPNTNDKKILSTYFQHMSEKVAKRLRAYNLQAKLYFIGIKIQDKYPRKEWVSVKAHLPLPNNDGFEIFKLCLDFLETHWNGTCVVQVQVTALDPNKSDLQADLFQTHDAKKQAINAIMDKINNKYGEFTLQPAPLINKTQMPNVISFNWSPDNIRDTIN